MEFRLMEYTMEYNIYNIYGWEILEVDVCCDALYTVRCYVTHFEVHLKHSNI